MSHWEESSIHVGDTRCWSAAVAPVVYDVILRNPRDTDLRTVDVTLFVQET